MGLFAARFLSLRRHFAGSGKGFKTGFPDIFAESLFDVSSRPFDDFHDLPRDFQIARGVLREL